MLNMERALRYREKRENTKQLDWLMPFWKNRKKKEIQTRPRQRRQRRKLLKKASTKILKPVVRMIK
jgi:hypothetical protein